MKLTGFKVLTFDCYGTLIDWESGIFNALMPLVRGANVTETGDQLLQTFAKHESAQEEETPAIPYSQLLSVVYKRLGKEWDVSVANEEAIIFGAAVPDWPEFPDSVDALQYLKKHYKLVILSNVDRISFRSSNARLKGSFDAIYTAQSLFHEHAPANRFGIASAWIDRRHAEHGWGATMPPPGAPNYDFRFHSMADLVLAHQTEVRRANAVARA